MPQVQDEMICTSFNKALRDSACGIQVSRIDHQLDGACNVGGITTNSGAMIIQYSIFVLEFFGRAACEVPDTRIAGYYA